MWYLIENFIGLNPIAKIRQPAEFTFLQGHICNGEIKAYGEESSDRWTLVVKDNEVFVEDFAGRHSLKDEGYYIPSLETIKHRYCYLRHIDDKMQCNNCEIRFKCYTT